QRQFRYAEAEPLFRRALALREKALPPGHPDVGQSLNNLATLYERQDRHADSEPLFKRALAIYQKTPGADPAVATLLNNFGQVLKAEGRYAEAEAIYQRALSVRERTVGPDHPDTVASLNNLASLYQAEGRTSDTLPLVERMMAGGRAQPRVALPTLLDAQKKQLIPPDKAFDEALDVVQHGAQSSAASA